VHSLFLVHGSAHIIFRSNLTTLWPSKSTNKCLLSLTTLHASRIPRDSYLKEEEGQSGSTTERDVECEGLVALKKTEAEQNDLFPSHSKEPSVWQIMRLYIIGSGQTYAFY
jgi:hypothetical protein